MMKKSLTESFVIWGRYRQIREVAVVHLPQKENLEIDITLITTIMTRTTGQAIILEEETVAPAKEDRAIHEAKVEAEVEGGPPRHLIMQVSEGVQLKIKGGTNPIIQDLIMRTIDIITII